MAHFLHQSDSIKNSPFNVGLGCQGTQYNVNLHLERVVGLPMGAHGLDVQTPTRKEAYVALSTVYMPKDGGTTEKDHQSEWFTAFLSISGAKQFRNKLSLAIAEAEEIAAHHKLVE